MEVKRASQMTKNQLYQDGDVRKNTAGKSGSLPMFIYRLCILTSSNEFSQMRV